MSGDELSTVAAATFGDGVRAFSVGAVTRSVGGAGGGWVPLRLVACGRSPAVLGAGVRTGSGDGAGAVFRAGGGSVRGAPCDGWLRPAVQGPQRQPEDAAEADRPVPAGPERCGRGGGLCGGWECRCRA
ncbi:hypothetical protein GCM10018787_26810 [Streptomyces thermodiastaticus]|nr:hypothetical protein GCM10018787_26810 [Streptomyces thermodiastaticus]